MTPVLAQGDDLFIPGITDDEFLVLCAQNRDQRIELTSEGKVIVMSGTGGKTGSRNLEISAQLSFWTRRDGRGAGFDSSTLFRLPNSAIRSPDGAWVSLAKLAALSEDQKDRVLPLCPEFVIELMSPTDRLTQVKLKMAEYIANGAELGWLIDPDYRRVIVYRPTGTETLDAPAQLTGVGPIAGFVLDMKRIWDPGW